MSQEDQMTRRQRLEACEKVFEEALEKEANAGLALKRIQEEKLYELDGCRSFQLYLRKFELTKKEAERLMGVGGVWALAQKRARGGSEHTLDAASGV